MSPGIGALAAQVDRRLRRHRDSATDCFRLCHGRGGHWPGLSAFAVDHFAGTVRIALHEARPPEAQAHLARALAAVCAAHDVRGAWLQHRYLPKAPAEILFGAPRERLVGREDGLAYHLHPGASQNAGLFLDARPARRWLRARAQGARVLNLFAYSCAFSLAALAGGAQSVVNVDSAAGALALGQRNHALNGLAGAAFLPHDVFRSWGALRRRGPYDWIIVDPPTHQRGSFELDRQLPRLLRRSAALLAPGGRLLLLVNSPFVTPADVAGIRREAAPELFAEPAPPRSVDFPDLHPERAMKSFLWRAPGGAGSG